MVSWCRYCLIHRFLRAYYAMDSIKWYVLLWRNIYATTRVLFLLFNSRVEIIKKHPRKHINSSVQTCYQLYRCVDISYRCHPRCPRCTRCSSNLYQFEWWNLPRTRHPNVSRQFIQAGDCESVKLLIWMSRSWSKSIHKEEPRIKNIKPFPTSWYLTLISCVVDYCGPRIFPTKFSTCTYLIRELWINDWIMLF